MYFKSGALQLVSEIDFYRLDLDFGMTNSKDILIYGRNRSETKEE